jgi:hypothetical protein
MRLSVGKEIRCHFSTFIEIAHFESESALLITTRTSLGVTRAF